MSLISHKSYQILRESTLGFFMQNLILQQGHTCKIGINIYTTSNSMDNIFCIGVFLNESTSYDITDRFDGISWQNALKMYSELLKKNREIEYFEKRKIIIMKLN